MRHGMCYQLVIVAPRMNGRECGLSQKIPTPRSNDAIDVTINPKILLASSYDSQRNGLTAFVTKWPTPCRTDYKGAGKTGTFRDRLDYAVERGRTKSNVYPTPCSTGKGGSHAAKKMKDILGQGNGGRLNPDWVEWLMGWPIGWTALKPMEMVKFQSWLSGRFVI